MLAFFLDFEGAKNIHVHKVLICHFGGCWRFLSGVWHLDLIWIWSLVFDIPMVQIFALFLHFEGANNIYVHEVLIWSFERHWRFLTGVWFGILMLIWIWSLVFGIPMIRILSLL